MTIRSNPIERTLPAAVLAAGLLLFASHAQAGAIEPDDLPATPPEACLDDGDDEGFDTAERVATAVLAECLATAEELGEITERNAGKVERKCLRACRNGGFSVAWCVKRVGKRIASATTKSCKGLDSKADRGTCKKEAAAIKAFNRERSNEIRIAVRGNALENEICVLPEEPEEP